MYGADDAAVDSDGEGEPARVHLSREYAVDPLEVLFAREAMRTEVVALSADLPLSDLTEPLRLHGDRAGLRQGLYPVVDAEGRLAGVVTRNVLYALPVAIGRNGHGGVLADIVKPNPIVAYPDEPLRVLVERMAETELTRFPVVAGSDPRRLVGLISLTDLQRARQRTLAEERTRERVLKLRFPAMRRERPLSPEGPVVVSEDRVESASCK
jgi:CIC family chloride channel protein